MAAGDTSPQYLRDSGRDTPQIVADRPKKRKWPIRLLAIPAATGYSVHAYITRHRTSNPSGGRRCCPN